MPSLIPVVLFAYARPDHLHRTLDALRVNEVPLIHAFSDGPKTGADASRVGQVRQILRAVDWCEMIVTERPVNLGLGASILAGVAAVFETHEAALVVEDDLICAPGAYHYLTEALQHYRDDAAVMSVTGWTHPRVTPPNVEGRPYFDGRAECWVWGTWARAWQGMERDAMTLMDECRRAGVDIYRYGADLPSMAAAERTQNIWAVRFLYLHLLRHGLCLRPPRTMVHHIGFDELGTNARDGGLWGDAAPLIGPDLPAAWPSAVENAHCARLWQDVYGGARSNEGRPAPRAGGWLRRVARGIKARVSPGPPGS